MVRKERKVVTKELRDLVLKMAQDEKSSIKKITEVFQLDRKAVRKILNDYENSSGFMTAAEKCKETCRNKSQNLKSEELGILNLISCNNSFTQNEVKEKINEQYGVLISQPTISRKLKKLSLTRKRLVRVPIERNTDARINERAIYGTELAMIGDNNLVFLDETGFNLHTSRSYGYSPVNTKAYITVPASRNINRSVLCVIGVEGVIAYECRTGAYNHSRFIEFIRNSLIPYFQQNPGKFLVMDNARFHHARDVQALLSENGIAVKFLVPYSPELNPIEEFFSMIKSRYNGLKTASNNLSIEEALHLLLGSGVNYSNECRNFFSNMRTWVEKARRREKFI